IPEVAEVDRASHDVAVVESDGPQQSADVFEHGPRLGLDAARDSAVATRHVTNLPGEEDEAVRLDDLRERVGAGLEARACRDGLWHGRSSSGWNGAGWGRIASVGQPTVRSHASRSGLYGSLGPPGEVLDGGHARTQDHARLGVEAL